MYMTCQLMRPMAQPRRIRITVRVMGRHVLSRFIILFWFRRRPAPRGFNPATPDVFPPTTAHGPSVPPRSSAPQPGRGRPGILTRTNHPPWMAFTCPANVPTSHPLPHRGSTCPGHGAAAVVRYDRARAGDIAAFGRVSMAPSLRVARKAGCDPASRMYVQGPGFLLGRAQAEQLEGLFPICFSGGPVGVFFAGADLMQVRVYIHVYLHGPSGGI